MLRIDKLMEGEDLYCARRGGHKIRIIKPPSIDCDNFSILGICLQCYIKKWWLFPREDFLEIYDKIKSGEV